ncbi:uncharacterized protein IL334_006734 [Kwoniella shivajii]|uniref:holo-[acyl-carrier-protein] synthase n=1 Tax=Kwoniella shivajii TaxID=564305 RepID=A0ABZ1D6R8_9TREE|nr:hypothetical protein IL334_006734 [Kwoniella shivajii]
MKIYAIKIPDEPISEETFDELSTLVEEPARGRLKRFRLPADSLRSLVARLTVTWYLNQNDLLPEGELPTFGRKGKGKPILSTPILDPPMEFNNTHESSFILFSILRSHSPLACVGIDIMSPVPDPTEVQEGISYQLTLSEKQSLSIPMSEDERCKRLMRMWTLKEGFTKAVGEGITFGLERIEVHLASTQQAGDIEKVLIDGKNSVDIGWEYKIGQVEDNYWAVWWRGTDDETEAKAEANLEGQSQRELDVINVNWDEFQGPLSELAERLTTKQ